MPRPGFATNFYQSSLSAKVKELEKWMLDAEIFEQRGQTFLKSFEDDESLSQFKTEYLKVMRIIKRSRENCEKLKIKSKDVEQEIIVAEHNPVDMSKLTIDMATLKTLKMQINRAEGMLAASFRREDTAKDELRQLRSDVANLNATIKQGVTLSASQEKAINELIQSKESTTKELEAELDKIVQLRTGLQTISDKIEATELERKSIDKEIFSLREKNAAKKLEIDMELGNKEKLERDLRELRVIVTIKSQEAVAKQNAVNRATEDITTIENQIKQQKLSIEKLLRDQELLGTRTVKLQQDYDEQMVYTTELMQQNEIALSELKVKEKELMNHRAEVKKVSRVKEALVKKSRILEETKVQEENERKVYRQHNDTLTAAINQKKKNVEAIKKSIDDLTRERDILKSDLTRTQFESNRLENIHILQKQQEVSLQLDIARMVREAAESEKEHKAVEYERDSLTEEANIMAAQSIQLLSELKNQELKIFDFKRQTIQAENKLKYQQNLYEAVQSDRKLHSKQLIESQAEISEMKRKLKIMNFQINGFKDDVNTKNSTLAKETDGLQKLTKDSELIKDEIKTLKSQNELAQAYIKTQSSEEFKLDQFVKEAEVERTRQQSALDLIMTERDNLSSQLLRRNQELTKVYDKIKTQNLSLLRGESHYRNKLRSIQSLREKILKYRVKATELATETEAIPTLKKQIVKLQNQVVQSQTRIKALEEELEYPINVHRWRKLEGSQPQTYAMLQLLHTLQKKLISKAKEESEKDRSIEIKEKLYLHLKTVLAKQAGPEASQQIQEFHKISKDKQVQLRHMETELNMYKSQVMEYKYSIQGLDSGLAQCKKELLKEYQERVRIAQGGQPSNNHHHQFHPSNEDDGVSIVLDASVQEESGDEEERVDEESHDEVNEDDDHDEGEGEDDEDLESAKDGEQGHDENN